MWPIGGQSSQCDEVAQPLSICQSFCHGGGPWILAATQAGPSSHGCGSASGKVSFFPPLFPSFSVPSAPSPAFISTLQAVPFQSIISSNPTPALWRRGEGGKHAKRCGIFFIVLGTHGDPSQGTLPFPSRFFFFSLSLPSSTSLWKATLAVFPANLLLSHQPKIPLECLCWSSGSGRASLRTQTVKETGFRWRRRKNKPKGTLAGVGQCVCLPSVHVCADEKDKIRLWLGRTQMIRDFCDFPSNPNRSYFPRKTSRFPTSLPNPDFALNPPPPIHLSLTSSLPSPSLIWFCNLFPEFNLGGKILWDCQTDGNRLSVGSMIIVCVDAYLYSP